MTNVMSTPSIDQEDLRLEEVKQLLSGILLPDSILNLIQSSVTRNIRVIQNDIYVRLFHGSDQAYLIDLVRSALQTIPWCNRVVVDPRTIQGVKRTLAVASGKGGVGKTSVTVALARSLKLSGYKVGILDADVYGPNISTILSSDEINVETLETSSGTKFVPHVVDDIKVISVGMLAEEGQSLAWRGPILTRLLKQFMFDVQWGELDFLLIDLPPGTGDAQITLLQECPLAAVLLVGIPGLSSQSDLIRTVSMFKEFNLPFLGYIENFSTVKCPHCGEHFSFLLDHSDGKESFPEIAGKDVPLIAQLQIHPEILTQRSSESVRTLDLVHSEVFSSLASTCAQLIS